MIISHNTLVIQEDNYVNQEKVEHYIWLIRKGEEITPIEVLHCLKSNSEIITDWVHRSLASQKCDKEIPHNIPKHCSSWAIYGAEPFTCPWPENCDFHNKKYEYTTIWSLQKNDS